MITDFSISKRGTERYPFGSTFDIPRGINDPTSEGYRYGWNKGSEKDDEITGVTGSHITTFFREYDTRLVRTWSLDPVFQPWQSPYTSMDNNPIWFNDPMGDKPDNHYVNDDGSLQTVKTSDNFDRFFVQDKFSKTGYRLAGQLNKNNAGLVQFPASGIGFGRYGSSDAGGTSTSPSEAVGQGDHYVKPETAAALFGLTNKLNKDFGINISLGDMSSSNGSDPWESGFKHHAGHGHLGKRDGLDVDFRYLDADGNSFQSTNAFNSSAFNTLNNQRVFDAASTFGFTKNYQGTSGSLTGASKVKGHNDHGHLGLQYKSLDWKFVQRAPTRQQSSALNLLE